jgi:hypothetical protein
MHVSLKLHPGTPSSPVEYIDVDVRREGGRLWLTYRVSGETGRIRWPVPAGAIAAEALANGARTDALWKHTCFEAFIRCEDGYREFNFATSGQWASYRFSGYRKDMAPADEQASLVSLEGRGSYQDLGVVVALPAVPGRLALSAVIEDIDGSLSYWALAHPSDKPDFHHPDSFTLTLPPPEPA